MSRRDISVIIIVSKQTANSGVKYLNYINIKLIFNYFFLLHRGINYFLWLKELFRCYFTDE